MSSQTEFKVEDFKGIGFDESWSKSDVLVAVCMEAKMPIKKRLVSYKLFETRKKKSVLFLIDEKDKPIKKRRFLDTVNETVDVDEAYLPFQKIRVSYECQETKSRRGVIPKEVQGGPDLPEAFYEKIAELSKGKNQTEETKPLLVIQKALYRTDVQPGQNRLSIPMNQMCCKEFLTEEEKKFIWGRTVDNHVNALEVTIIEPSLRVGTIKLAKWDYKKADGKKKKKKNMSYVLNGTWKDIVTNNDLEADMKVQVWAFRVEGKLCVALVKLS